MRADARLGGHFVAGHIDSVSRVMATKNIGRSWQMEIELPEKFADLVVDKGSIAIDGTSLTVTAVAGNSLTVNLIPETRKDTTLESLKPGDHVNVEYDLFGKYILRFLDRHRRDSKLTLESLREMGY